MSQSFPLPKSTFKNISQKKDKKCKRGLRKERKEKKMNIPNPNTFFLYTSTQSCPCQSQIADSIDFLVLSYLSRSLPVG